MGASTRRGVPFMHKVDTVQIAETTRGVCFVFGNGCNLVFHDGQFVGQILYVGDPGPGMLFKVADKEDSVPGDFDDKYVELLKWKQIPVPLME